MESIKITEAKIIISRLDELIEAIDQLPYPSNIRTIIKYNVANDFYDSWQFDDKVNKFSYRKYILNPDDEAFIDAKFTQGVINFQQLNRYIFEFISIIKHVRLRSLEEIFYPVVYPTIEFSKVPLGINFTEVTRYTFLWKYHLNFLTEEEVDSQIQKILGPRYEEIKYQNSLSRASQISDKVNISKALIERAALDIYMVEELEIMLCSEAVNYFDQNVRRNLRYDYDPQYFDKFVSGKLYTEYLVRLKEKIDPLPNDVAIEHLINSKNQFFSHTPESRRQFLYDKFWDLYVFPEVDKSNIIEPFIKYMDFVIEAYCIHFELFEDATEKYLNKVANKFDESTRIDYAEDLFLKDNLHDVNSLDGIQALFKSNEIDEMDDSNFLDKSNNRTEPTLPLSYTYKNNQKNYSAVIDLLDSLQKNKFISLDTDKKVFRKIFENSNPQKPIIWTGSLSELAHFVKLLHNEYESINSLGNNIWKVTAKLFVNREGKPFEWQRFKGQKKPAKANLLEKAALLLN